MEDQFGLGGATPKTDRVIITSVNGAKFAISNVPFDTIMRLIQEHIDKEKRENEENDIPSIVRYIRDQYPFFYKIANVMGLLDEAFAGGIHLLAENWGYTDEVLVDLLLREHNDGMSAKIISQVITDARSRWIEQNKKAE